MENLYDILEIDIDAEEKVIKRAYRKLALKWHPDKNSDPTAHDKFIKINEAYEILSNPEKKEVYDSLLRDELLKSVITVYSKESEKEHDYNSFNQWKHEAKMSANERAKMPFQEFKEFVGDIVRGTINFFNVIFMGAMYIAWGPYGLIYSIIKLVEVINNFGTENVGIWQVFITIVFVLVTSFVTLGGGVAIVKFLRDNL
ncbi:J domain-containing protein [Paracrocinitomix mangrovi]|uniref:J domain-containing protein n=1 Tax=Paracrocinitomix mangrovi TaxID=2862509 RepID=UPI001C8E1DC2|nr:J domain-containing protein [Paracrocinitomix mangrovi]UKN00208.1 J domain-containing protein [Paracrocinitomix mangrovi]